MPRRSSHTPRLDRSLCALSRSHTRAHHHLGVSLHTPRWSPLHAPRLGWSHWSPSACLARTSAHLAKALSMRLALAKASAHSAEAMPKPIRLLSASLRMPSQSPLHAPRLSQSLCVLVVGALSTHLASAKDSVCSARAMPEPICSLDASLCTPHQSPLHAPCLSRSLYALIVGALSMRLALAEDFVRSTIATLEPILSLGVSLCTPRQSSLHTPRLGQSLCVLGRSHTRAHPHLHMHRLS